MGAGIWYVFHKDVVRKSISREEKEGMVQDGWAKRYLRAEGLASKGGGLS